MKIILGYILIALVGQNLIWGQEKLTPQKELKIKQESPMGWTPKLKLSSHFSFQSNDQVIGQETGETITLGLSSDFKYNYKSEKTEWRNSFIYKGALTRTPTVPRYVKTSDNLELESLYLKSFETYPKLGPYFSVKIEAPVFIGESVKAQEVVYATPEGNKTLSSLKLTEPFRPLKTKEALGFFYKAVAREKTKLEFRMGVGAQQVSANNQLQVTSDDQATVTVEELKSYDQVGVEYGWLYKGQWGESSDYEFKGDFLTPMNGDIPAGEVCSECKGIELTDFDVSFKTGIKILKWMKISYEYKAMKQPRLYNRIQISQGFKWTMEYDFL